MIQTIKTFVLISGATTLLFAGAALAQEPPAMTPAEQFQDAVNSLLSGVERAPNRKDWDRVGTPDKVIAELQRRTGDKDPIMAERALSALADFPTPEVRGFLEKRAPDPKGDVAQRGKALIALGFAFKDAALDMVASRLTDKNPALREDAIRAFSSMSSAKAEGILRKRLELEPAKHIGSMLQGMIQGVAGNRARKTTPRGMFAPTDEDRDRGMSLGPGRCPPGRTCRSGAPLRRPARCLAACRRRSPLCQRRSPVSPACVDPNARSCRGCR
jgi:hypothetical protein